MAAAGGEAQVENRFRIHQDAVVSADAVLRGQVTVGAGCVVYPGARILALAGPIELGSSNLVEEGAELRTVPGPHGEGSVMVVGSFNTFQSGCSVASAVVGDGNVVEAKAQLMESTTVGSGSVVCSRVVVRPKGSVESGTVLYGATGRRPLPDGQRLNTEELKPRLAFLHRQQKTAPLKVIRG